MDLTLGTDDGGGTTTDPNWNGKNEWALLALQVINHWQNEKRSFGVGVETGKLRLTALLFSLCAFEREKPPFMQFESLKLCVNSRRNGNCFRQTKQKMLIKSYCWLLREYQTTSKASSVVRCTNIRVTKARKEFSRGKKKIQRSKTQSC